jgi:hypothetical protein
MEMRFFLIDKKEFKSLSNLAINRTYIYNLIDIYDRYYTGRPNEIETDKAIKNSIETNKKPSCKLYVKVGYVDGKKMVRFAITISDINFENCYYELPYDIFSRLLIK